MNAIGRAVLIVLGLVAFGVVFCGLTLGLVVVAGTDRGIWWIIGLLVFTLYKVGRSFVDEEAR